MKIIHQNSILWGSAFILVILDVLLFQDGVKNEDFVIFGGNSDHNRCNLVACPA